MVRWSVFRPVAICFAMLVSLGLCLHGKEDAIAATVSWKSAVSGNWSDGTKWDTGVPPASTDDVVIAVDGTYTVTLDVNATVNSLTLGGTTGTQTLSAVVKILTLSGSSFIGSHGTLSMYSTTINAGETLTNHGTMNLERSTISGAGTLTSKGILTLQSSCTIDTVLVNGGTVRVSGWEIIFNGPFTNEVGAVLRVGKDVGSTDLTVVNAVNHGTMEIWGGGAGWRTEIKGGLLTNATDGQIIVSAEGGGSRYLKMDLDNQGLMVIDHPTTLVKDPGVITNSGTIQVNEDTYSNSPWLSFTNRGTITVASGKRFSYSTGQFVFAAGSFLDGLGELSFEWGSPPSGVTLTADVSIAGNLRLYHVTMGGPHTLTILSGGTFILDGNNTIETGLANEGTIRAVGATLTANETVINGLFTNQAGGMLRLGGVGSIRLLVENGINHGTIEMKGPGTTELGGDALTNATNGVIDVSAEGGGLRKINLNLDNQGLVVVNYPLTISKASATHTNGGTIQANGDVTVSQSGTSPSFTNRGTITVASGKKFTVSGGVFTNASGGILQGSGTIHVAGTSFTNSGDINPGTSPGVLTFTGNVPQTSTGVMNVEIGGLSAGTEHDRVSISGAATFSGTLNVTLLSSFEPNIGDTFTVITCGSKSGTFTNTYYPALPGGKQWKITYNATSVVLSVETGLPEAPEINVKENGTNIPDNTGSYDFGHVNPGSNKAVTFTIENLGTGPLTLTGTPYVAVGGAQGSDFEVTTQPASPIGSGSFTTFVITFTPKGPGVRSTTVTIANDDSDENPYDFTITGTCGGVPVAHAGPDQNVSTGVEVTLDGSDSYDPDGQLLSFLWSLASKPSASALTDADVEGKTTPNPSFTPDVEGVYQFRLVVNDGSAESDPDTVEIRAFPPQGNIRPNARAGQDLYEKVNTLVVLDGSGSYDPDDGPADMLTYQWSFKVVPPGSGLLGQPLLDGDQVSASFVPDVEGKYVVELQVSDGAATDTDEVIIRAYSTNVPPNARAGQDQRVAPGEEVILDGTTSFDPDEGPGPLTYQWGFVFIPAGSGLTNGSILNPTTATPKFTPDVEGTYVVELMVSDGAETDIDHVMVVATTEPWVEVKPSEGTVGTEFTLKGHDCEFGFSKGKLFMGKRTLKAVSWASESIFIRVKKPNPPATYDIQILPKKPKGGVQRVIWEPRCFTVRVPEVKRIVFISAEQGYRVTGRFFGTKKGKIYLGDLACKVKTWSMNPATNESEATFLLPKGVTSGTFMLNVVNKVGRGKMEVTLP